MRNADIMMTLLTEQTITNNEGMSELLSFQSDKDIHKNRMLKIFYKASAKALELVFSNPLKYVVANFKVRD